MNPVEKAIIYAMRAHDGQFRDDGETPYLSHLHTVAALLRLVTSDPEIIAAGWLHDTLEDTGTTYEQLEQEFGSRIAGLVQEVTKDADGNFTSLKSRDAVILKFADRLSNLSDMRDWDEKKVKWYINKSRFW